MRDEEGCAPIADDVDSIDVVKKDDLVESEIVLPAYKNFKKDLTCYMEQCIITCNRR